MRALLLILAGAFAAGAGSAPSPAFAQATPGVRAVTPESGAPVNAAQVKAAIDRLGDLDFTVRMSAGRTVRRAPANVAVPALLEAVAAHKDQYIRPRALVLLSGFNDPRTHDVMLGALTDKNDRLRSVAYAFFERLEHARAQVVVPRLLTAAEKEASEFVRPALMRALAAHAGDARVRAVVTDLVMKGQDFFRSAVIEAIGDYKGAYAAAQLTEVAKLDGPLQDDAVIALGKLGDKRAIEVFAALQRSAPRETQPSIAAAICLLGVNCSSHVNYLIEALGFAIANPGFQELLRAAAGGLATLAVTGNEEALEALIAKGAPTQDPARAAIALALGRSAVQNTPLMLRILERQSDPESAVELLREAFDMLEEDFAEERFFVTVRRGYWQAAERSATRKVAELLIRKLEF